jgi:hypothetical protein
MVDELPWEDNLLERKVESDLKDTFLKRWSHSRILFGLGTPQRF